MFAFQWKSGMFGCVALQWRTGTCLCFVLSCRIWDMFDCLNILCCSGILGCLINRIIIIIMMDIYPHHSFCEGAQCGYNSIGGRGVWIKMHKVSTY